MNKLDFFPHIFVYGSGFPECFCIFSSLLFSLSKCKNNKLNMADMNDGVPLASLSLQVFRRALFRLSCVFIL